MLLLLLLLPFVFCSLFVCFFSGVLKLNGMKWAGKLECLRCWRHSLSLLKSDLYIMFFFVCMYVHVRSSCSVSVFLSAGTQAQNLQGSVHRTELTHMSINAGLKLTLAYFLSAVVAGVSFREKL